MMNNPILLSVFSALTFAAWPIISRFSGLPGIWVSLTMSVGTLIAVIVGKMFFPGGDAIYTKAIALGILAGAVNGAGIIAFGLITSNKNWDISIYIPMTFGVMLALASISGIVLLGESLSPQKIIGVLVIIFGIYLIR